MDHRPPLSKDLEESTFRSFYYLKEELVAFCREQGLPTSGSKLQLTDRIAHYLSTGEVVPSQPPVRGKMSSGEITLTTEIEPNFTCSERHRAFFRQEIGNSFSFLVPFQKWLKANTGKTYAQAIAAYHQILAEKKTKSTAIDKQFEYNTYIRDFFQENPGKTLHQAIQCWKYKKSLPGHNRYAKSDLLRISP